MVIGQRYRSSSNLKRRGGNTNDAKTKNRNTQLDYAKDETTSLIRKDGGKTGEEPNLLEVKRQLFNCSLNIQ